MEERIRKYCLPGMQEAAKLDAEDDLACFRDYFYIPDSTVYLDGNSLGLLSKSSEQLVLSALSSWKSRGIDGWTEGPEPWFFMAEQVGARMSSIIGAQPDEVIATGSTTVNLHQLISTFYRPAAGKSKILIDADSFPSDLYAVTSHLKLRGQSGDTIVKLHSSRDRMLDETEIVAAYTDDIALAVLSSVVYTSGQLLDIERLTKAAAEHKILVIWDCSHSVGAVPHRFNDWGVDAAIWCGYKYLNGGPGSIAGLYVSRLHFPLAPGLAGWFGSNKSSQFDMARDLRPADGAGALQIGSPHILSLAPLLGSMGIIEQARIERIRAKSVKLTDFLIRLAESELLELGVTVVTPREARRRGGHVALAHPEAARICKALKAHGVVPDHRPPDIIRLAPTALYNRFADCSAAIGLLKDIIVRRLFESFDLGRALVS